MEATLGRLPNALLELEPGPAVMALTRTLLLLSLMVARLAAAWTQDWESSPWMQNTEKRSFGSSDSPLQAAKSLSEAMRENVCSKDLITELFPRIISMKRTLLKRLHSSTDPGVAGRERPVDNYEADSGVDADPVQAWTALEWMRQLQDIERRLAFCNRRNHASKLRLL